VGSFRNLTNKQRSLILGTLLGDGTIECSWKNPRVRITHSAQQKEYVFWKYDILKNICGHEPHALDKLDKRSGKSSVFWYFSTNALPELHFYHRLFYRDQRKIIATEISDHLRDPLSLAVWLMDDGYKRNDCDALRLSTDCFPYREQLFLCQILDKNFGIGSTLHNKGSAWNIYSPSTQMKTVRALLEPYIIPSMKYKLPVAP
jgi:hypothetical protein